MDNSFFDALSLLGSENNVDIAQLVEKVKSAMLKAARKAYPECEDNITVEIDPATKKFEMYVRQTVVDDEPIDANEVNIDVARTVDPNAYVGGTIDRRLDIAKFGRAAAQSAKQSIKGDLREINRERILGEFESLENDCITCEVSRVETNGTATLLYHKTELYLFPNEQIPGETLREGQRVKVYITTIANKQKKPIIKISRVRKELVKRLFELEIPEIYDGTVEIKSISREAGSRTKVAVWSKDENVDAIGACIGPKRSRISAIERRKDRHHSLQRKAGGIHCQGTGTGNGPGRADPERRRTHLHRKGTEQPAFTGDRQQGTECQAGCQADWL